jgi:hypothetical protein
VGTLVLVPGYGEDTGMNWGATAFFGVCAIVAVCTIGATVEDMLRGWLRARRVVEEAIQFQRRRKED